MSHYPTPKISHPSNDTCRWESHFWRRPEDTEDTGSFPQPLIRKRREVGHLSPHAEQVASRKLTQEKRHAALDRGRRRTVLCSSLRPQRKGQLCRVCRLPTPTTPDSWNIFIHLPGDSGNSLPSHFYWRHYMQSLNREQMRTIHTA